MTEQFNIGDPVIAIPKPHDDFHEFIGTIIDLKEPYFLVEDQDGDVFEVPFDQLEADI